MTLFEHVALVRIVQVARRFARQQPKRRAYHMRTVIRAKRRLRKAA